MIPYLDLPSFHIGPFQIQQFGLLVCIGIVVRTILAKRRARRGGLDPGVVRNFVVAEDEHGVRLQLLGVGDLGFDRVGAGVERGADSFGAEFLLDAARVFEERGFVADGEDADLLGASQSGNLSA